MENELFAKLLKEAGLTIYRSEKLLDDELYYDIARKYLCSGEAPINIDSEELTEYNIERVWKEYSYPETLCDKNPYIVEADDIDADDIVMLFDDVTVDQILTVYSERFYDILTENIFYDTNMISCDAGFAELAEFGKKCPTDYPHFYDAHREEFELIDFISRGCPNVDLDAVIDILEGNVPEKHRTTQPLDINSFNERITKLVMNEIFLNAEIETAKGAYKAYALEAIAFSLEKFGSELETSYIINAAKEMMADRENNMSSVYEQSMLSYIRKASITNAFSWQEWKEMKNNTICLKIEKDREAIADRLAEIVKEYINSDACKLDYQTILSLEAAANDRDINDLYTCLMNCNGEDTAFPMLLAAVKNYVEVTADTDTNWDYIREREIEPPVRKPLNEEQKKKATHSEHDER